MARALTQLCMRQGFGLFFLLLWSGVYV